MNLVHLPGITKLSQWEHFFRVSSVFKSQTQNNIRPFRSKNVTFYHYLADSSSIARKQAEENERIRADQLDHFIEMYVLLTMLT